MKTFAALILAAAVLCGSDGDTVYKERCASCHLVMLPLEKKQREAAVMKAPTMRMVSMRLKNMIHIKSEDEDIHRAVIVGYIRYYLEKPDEDYALCMEKMLEKYGVMPPQTGLSDDEKEAVAHWIFDQF